MKPTANQVARAATAAAHVGYTYEEMDCQAFIEHCVRQAGGSMDYRGSNDMARGAAWLGTLSQARAQGRLVPGAGVLYVYLLNGGKPARALRRRRPGRLQPCGPLRGRGRPHRHRQKRQDAQLRRGAFQRYHGPRAGSTLQGGWTHVLWFPDIDYGASGGAGNAAAAGTAATTAATGAGTTGDGLTAGASPVRFATVVSPDGNPVKLRKSASREETLYWLVGAGARVEVERTRDGWSLIRAICTDGRTRRAWMMDRYLRR